VPVFLSFLGGEVKPGVIRPRPVPMTTTRQMTDIVTDLRAGGAARLLASYIGYQKGGYAFGFPARLPVPGILGGTEGLSAAARQLAGIGVPLALETDYVYANESAGGFTPRRDATRQVNGQMLGGDGGYFLSPRKGMSLAAADAKLLPEAGISAVTVSGSIRILSSDQGSYTRDAAAAEYGRAMSVLRAAGMTVMIAEPNEYLLAHADAVLGVEQYSSLHAFETDTVPFYQIVLKGYVPYFADSSNFDSDPREEFLRSIEYGAYPSFVVTAAPSRELEETASSDFYSTWYPQWKARILEEYAAVNAALKAVQGRRIVGRTVPSPGVVEVLYEGGAIVAVNYTAAPVVVAGRTIEAQGFALIPEAPRAAAR
jgi:hypothetical protein